MKKSNKNKSRAVLIEGSVGKLLIKMTGPMMIGMIGMVIFNLVDTGFVGRLGTEELAAMSFTFPVVLLQGSFSMGLGVGASSVISRFIGAGDHDKAKLQTTASLILALLIVAVLVTIGLLTIDPLFTLLGADEETLPLIRQYMRVWYPGLAFVVIPMVGNNAMRAAGNTTIPSTIMLIAVLINICLDPLLIFGIGPFPRLGLQGAALATVFSRMTTFCCSLLFLRFKFDLITFRPGSFSVVFKAWEDLLYIGIPAILTQFITPVSLAIITRMVSVFGKEAVAAAGVGSRVQMFALSPLMALGSVMVPFVGQNAGAQKFDRIHKGLRLSRFFSLLLGAVFFVICALWGKQIGSIFNHDSKVIEITGAYLFINSIGFGMLGVLAVHASALNALRKPLQAALITLFQMAVLYIPAAWLLSRFFQLQGIFLGALVSSLVAGAVSWWVVEFYTASTSKPGVAETI